MNPTTSPQQGALLIQLGTPEAPTTAALRNYLSEFLMDPSVIDLPFLLRLFLVRGLIVPRRSPHSAAAYRKIWTSTGSPLRVHTENLAKKVGAHLGPEWKVVYAMRYGNPSIPEALEHFAKQKIKSLRILPLYPQFAEASFGSSVRKAIVASKKMKDPFQRIEVVSPFYANKTFLQAVAHPAKIFFENKPDFTLFTFHGLPERHIQKMDLSRKCCLKKSDCCEESVPFFCYRAQCFSTARSLADILGLKPKEYQVSFQSRLGRDPWLLPSTEVVLRELGEKKINRLTVISPSFTTDCLETLEELGMRGKEIFQNAGGGEFNLVPCPNDNEDWVETISQLLVSGKASSLEAWGERPFSRIPEFI